MHPHPSDQTAREMICEHALRLFAEHGVQTVSLRQVAAAAGVSPSLVVHHFKGKDGLRDAVNERAMRLFEDFVKGVVPPATVPLPDVLDSFLPWRLVSWLPAGSPLPAHLGKLLMSDEPLGRQIFRLWHQVILARLDARLEDRTLRAAWLTANDLAVLLLRHQLRSLLGDDPLEREQARRWAQFQAVVYRRGLLSDR
jgi:AcrR family transcriptional regulator